MRASALFVPGKQFGIGEQHVYAIQSHATLTVRLRPLFGDLISVTKRLDRSSSYALTVERYDSSGRPVLTAAASSSATADDLAPVSALLAGLTSDSLSAGKSWSGDSTLRMPVATVALHLTNTAGASSGDQLQTTMMVSSDGRESVRGALRLTSIGKVTLRGGGTSSATSYFELNHRLLLGMRLVGKSSGTALAQDMRGTYELNIRYSVELARFVPGAIVPTEIPGFRPASTYVLSPLPVDTTNMAPAPFVSPGRPAPIDTEYAPLSETAGTPTPAPALSLPPIPFVPPSGQQLVSPPPPPSPTPTPRR